MYQRMPIEYNVLAVCGADLLATFRWLEDTTPKNLTGWTAWMPVGTSRVEPSLFELTSSGTTAGTVELSDDGYIVITMTDTATDALADIDPSILPVQGGAGQLVYDLFLQEPTGGTVYTFLSGKFMVQHSVPRYVA